MHALRRTAAPFGPARRPLQLRLALLYSGVVFVSGAVLIAIPNFLLASASSTVQPGSQTSSGGPAITPGHGPVAHNLLVVSAITLVILAPLSLAVGWLIAGRFLRPLRAMTATAHALSARNLSSRLELDGVDEFG